MLPGAFKNLNGSLESQIRLVKELEAFKSDLQPQLDSARREIELNKSMLDMLNNEIQLLNSEKLDLEKRLLTTRRNNTPSVIIEEDEAELEEQHHDEDDDGNQDQGGKRMMIDAGGAKSSSSSSSPRVHRSGRKRHRRKANGAALERILENEEENGEEQSEPSDEDTTSGSDHSREDKSDLASPSASASALTDKSNDIYNHDYTHHSDDHIHINNSSNFVDNNYDIDLLHSSSHQMMTADGILILNKQIEDMTFYVDELKSELEAEREKSNEYQSEIRALQQRLERTDEQEEVVTSSLKVENERLQKELVDALLRIKEIESQASNEHVVGTGLDQGAAFDKAKLERLLSIVKEDLLNAESSTALNLDRINAEQDYLASEPHLKDFFDSLNAKLSKSAENYERECERVKYIENQMVKAVQDFKQEISSLEQKLDESQKDYLNFKLQVRCLGLEILSPYSFLTLACTFEVGEQNKEYSSGAGKRNQEIQRNKEPY